MAIPDVEQGGGGFSGFSSFGDGEFFGLPVGPEPAQPSPVAAAPLDFDFDLSQIQRAIARGNTREDVESAYELFTTGQTRGRALEYARSDIARFGFPSLRHAAAHYLDVAGLPRLALAVTPDPGNGDTSGGGTAPRNPFEVLADVFRGAFGQATYNPPLQTQAYGATPVTVSDGGGGLGSISGWLILGGLAIAAYFIYKRVSA